MNKLYAIGAVLILVVAVAAFFFSNALVKRNVAPVSVGQSNTEDQAYNLVDQELGQATSSITDQDVESALSS